MKAEFINTYTVVSQKEMGDMIIIFKQRTINCVKNKKSDEVKTEVEDVDVCKLLIPKDVVRDLINSITNTLEKEENE